MNVSEQIINVLDNLCQKFGLVIDWSAENILPYLKELCGKFINYEINTSITWIVIMLILCVIFWIVFAATFKPAKKVKWDLDYAESWINELFLLISIIWSVISILVVSIQAFDIIEAIYLPEKTIYDFINYQINLHH
jgi:hypothetical protein